MSTTAPQATTRIAILLSFLALFVLAASVASAGTSPDAKCRKKRLALFAKAIRSEASCYGRAITQGSEVDAECLRRAAARLDASWSKNDNRGDCDEQAPEFLSNAALLVNRIMEEAVGSSENGMSAAPDGNEIGPPRLIFSAPFCKESPPELEGGVLNLPWLQAQLEGPIGTRCIPQPKDAAPLWSSSYIDQGDAGNLCRSIAEQVFPAAADVEWDAWVSTSNSSPTSRFLKSTGPYRLPSGTVVADDWSDLTDGTLQNPIYEDIFGLPPSSTSAITATRAAGEFSGEDCGDWQDYGILATATRGEVTAVDSAWTEQAAGSCSSTQASGLICVQQDGPELVDSLPPPERLVFFMPSCPSSTSKSVGPLPSSAFWPVNPESLAGACGSNLVDLGFFSPETPPSGWMALVADQGWGGGDCYYLAVDRGLVDSSATFDIWFSTENTSPSTRFTQAKGKYVLPSGIAVANGWSDLTDSSLDHAINENVDAIVLPSARALTGSTGEGGSAETCSNWENYTEEPAGPPTQATWGSTYATDAAWTDSSEPMACTDTLGFAEMGFYCVQQSGSAPVVASTP